MEVREKLADIVSRNNLDEFLVFIKEHKSSLLNIVEGYTKKQLDKIWEEVQQTFAPVLLSLDEAGEDALEEEMRRVQSVLESVVTLAKSTIAQPEPHVSPCLLSTAFVLHGLLLEIPDKADGLRNSITGLFEDWWKKELQGREMLAANTITVLIEKSLLLKGASSVKRVWSLHSVLEQLDLKNESSSRLCEILKRCIINVNYLCNEEGCRFLGYILTLESDLMVTLHKTIKNHIPSAPKFCLEKYGEIYFRAWQKATESIKEKLEQSCIQDLMYFAVHAQKPLAIKLRKILGYLHRQKSVRGVDKMLLTLYEPFLWRSLNVANPQVRGNAAVLLMDAFPLENPENSLEENDELLQKQFNHLHSLLEDPIPSVRSIAVPGQFKILSRYWDVIPVSTVKNILTTMIQDLVNDTTSAEVRESVIRGMIVLMDNPLSHPMLKPVLPTLRNNIHDHSEKVRVAMVDLLLKVQKIRTIKAWDIVPVDHLLVRLGMDKPPVVRRVMKLTFRSFLPLDKPCEVQMERCMAMIVTNPAAARVFFSNIPKHISVQETATFMINICRTILKLITKAKKQSAGHSEARGDSSEMGDQDGLSIDNIPVMRGFIEGMHIMWKSIEADLAEESHKDLLQELYQKFSLAVPEMLKSFEDSQICLALVLLSGNLPPKSIPTISRSLMSKLKSMSSESKMEDFCPILEALCSWKKVSDLCELIEEWLTDSLNITTKTDSAKGKKSSRKSVKFVDPTKSNPSLAVKYTSCLLKNNICRTALLSHTEGMNSLLNTFSKILDCIGSTCKGRTDSTALDETCMVECFTVYCKMLLVRHERMCDEDDEDSVNRLTHILMWAQETLLPHLAAGDDDTPNDESSTSKKRAHVEETTTHLARDILKTVFITSSSVLLIGAGTIEFTVGLANFCSAYFKSDNNLLLLPEALKCLHQVTAYTMFVQLESATDHHDNQKIVPECLSHMLVSVATFCKDKCASSAQVLSQHRVLLCDILSATQQSTDISVHQEVMATLVAAVIADLANASSKLDLEGCENGLSSLPPLTSWLCQTLTQKASLFKSFMKEFESCLQSGAVLDIHRVHAAIHLIGAIVKWKSRTSGVKEICAIVQQQVERGDFVKDEENSTDVETLTMVREKLKAVQEQIDMVH